MIDFKKKLGLKSIKKKVNPIEIYDSLDRRSETGPLRPIQREVLEEWWENRKDDRDNILKLHTGQGKTLIGLLILQSRLNEKKGPCLYICPNKYLVKQTRQQADRFGIKYTSIDQDKSLPDDFVNSEKILITHVQKVFNGKSIFGIGGQSTKVNTVLLDDSHACIDSISESFKIKVKKEHDLYQKLMQLFEEDLKTQGEGTYLEIQDKESDSTNFLPVPYWSWQDKKSEVLDIIYKYNKDDAVKFAWPLIKDSLENCQCFFSSKLLEISTFLNPIDQFGSFSQAEHRILMSATTQNDSFFIKGLGLSTKAVENPLTAKNEKWSGEKMILIPSLINEYLEREYIIRKITNPKPNFKLGIVAITPSFKKSDLYNQHGALVVKSNNIFQEINQLKQGNANKTIVVVNRYDGIDLPDEACRILILDSCPFAESLTERYEEDCRSDSEILNIKIAQKIEQGLGRSVRGERDYSVILLIGNELVKFVKSNKSSQYFSEQTRKQIKIGLEIAEMSKEEDQDYSDPFKTINKLIVQCLKRDEGWKEFYKERMDLEEEEAPVIADKVIDIFKLERKAEESFFKNETEDAVLSIQKIIDTYYADNNTEKGWYLQILARYQYKISKTDSVKSQKNAHKYNQQLLKPKEGIIYKKLDYINEDRIRRIKKWIADYKNYEEMMLALDSILSNLSFGEPSEKFEKALQDLGLAVGFLSERPDKEIKKGPDNLWCGVNNEYFIFECKNEVKDSRKEITKSEIGQMNNHCAWFKKEYNTEKVKRIMVIQTKNASNQGNFAYEVEIMRKAKLKDLKDHVKSFFKEFNKYDIQEVSDTKIQEWINTHQLNIDSLKTKYTEKYYQKK